MESSSEAVDGLLSRTDSRLLPEKPLLGSLVFLGLGELDTRFPSTWVILGAVFCNLFRLDWSTET